MKQASFGLLDAAQQALLRLVLGMSVVCHPFCLLPILPQLRGAPNLIFSLKLSICVLFPCPPVLLCWRLPRGSQGPP